MSLLAESLVEEWLNRAGYFTIRGARRGVSEMDLLAARHTAGGLEARHIEVQVSTNPVAYISALTKQHVKEFGKTKTSAWKRPEHVLEDSVSAWVEKKFFAQVKVLARNRAWPGLDWSLEFIHGVVRHPDELELIRSHNIKTHTFHSILASLCTEQASAQKGGAGTDIVEMIAYYVRQENPPTGT
jgi:hypothetical protein